MTPSEPVGLERRSTPLDPDGDISVVIVSYRTPGVLADCLASFERHRPRRVKEVIVVDNSLDTEVPPTEPFPWLRYAANTVNVHFRKGVNQGARLAAERYLLLLNPDTYLTDGESLALLAEVLDERPDIGLAGPRIRGDDGRLAPQGERFATLPYLVAEKTYLNVLWPGNPIRRRHLRPRASREVSGRVDTLTAAALLCRRDEFLAAGGFDERAVVYWEEQELARALARRGLRAYYRADAFVFHRWRKGGGEHEPPELLRRRFEEAMRLYYARFYGLPGRLLFDALTVLQRLLRGARRAARA